MQVVKRDGRTVPFNAQKIVDAVTAAMRETDAGVDTALAQFIATKIESVNENQTVEQIQDLVEHYLMSSERKDAAKRFIIYRAERTKAREAQSAIVQQVWQKTNASNVVNANANVDEYSFGGRKNEAASAVQKEIALNYNMSPEVAAAHKDGWFYEHDLDAFNTGSHNCLFLDFGHIFANGFSTRNGDVRPPATYSTACQQVAVAFQLQSQCQFGGVASLHIDRDLAPFVAKSFTKHYKDGLRWAERVQENIDELADKASVGNPDQAHLLAYDYAVEMLEREGKQSSEALFHNLNTLESRAGSQVKVA